MECDQNEPVQDYTNCRQQIIEKIFIGKIQFQKIEKYFFLRGKKEKNLGIKFESKLSTQIHASDFPRLTQCESRSNHTISSLSSITSNR